MMFYERKAYRIYKIVVYKKYEQMYKGVILIHMFKLYEDEFKMSYDMIEEKYLNVYRYQYLA